MSRLLYITTELPYFPGQSGLMALQIRYLSRQHCVGIVGPRHRHQPEDALQNLRDTVQRSYWWPEYPVPGDLPAGLPVAALKRRWWRPLPRKFKSWLLRRLAGLHCYSDEAVAWRAVLVNLAPKILEALREEQWDCLLLAQSNSATWLPFLPASLARCIYFHDVRSDYLGRSPGKFPKDNLKRTRTEELLAVREVEAAAFVSDLDLARAVKLLAPPCETAVVPICVDLDYFTFQSSAAATEPVVLFTGHLAHPPNVDAVLYFLSSIWPSVLAAQPKARFLIVGLQPVQAVVDAAAGSPGVELLPNVPDVRPYFRLARVYVVPMRYGGGVRNKILEAWALGTPVVTTAMGAEGLAARNGENCWVRDEPGAFAAQIVALLNDPGPAPVLSAARSEVEQNHSLQASAPRMAALLDFAIKRRRQSSPRVLFDLRWLRPGKVGGIEQMVHELVDELAACDRTFEYRFHGASAVVRRWRFPAGFKHKLFCPDAPKERRLAYRDALAGQLASDLAMPPLTSPELRALEWYARLDFTVVHGIPSHVHPDLRRFPSVVTMHDLQHLHLPEFFKTGDITTREEHYRESCHQASHLICVSEFTRRDVHERYGVPLEKMTTIWNLPPRLTAAAMPQSQVDRLLKSMQVKSPFLFYPAQPWLHKNHCGLIEAMKQADRLLPAEYKLILTGQPFASDHPAAALLADPAVSKRVIHLGYRSPLEIVALYHSAEALVFPSRFEGFGMPLLEAMQQKCPVVCGHHTSLPEIAGDAALYVDVASPGALAEAIIRIVRDGPLRAELQQKGTENLRRFDRRALAEKTRAIYASVHDRHFA